MSNPLLAAMVELTAALEALRPHGRAREHLAAARRHLDEASAVAVEQRRRPRRVAETSPPAGAPPQPIDFASATEDGAASAENGDAPTV